MRFAALAVLALVTSPSVSNETPPTAPPARGTYWQDPLCPKFYWCVEWVRIDANGSLEVGTSWRGQDLDKGSDANNRQIYLVDAKGRRYDHVAVSGVAAYGYVERSLGRRKVHGSFLFPRPDSGAARLALRDDAQGRVIEGISFDVVRRSSPEETRAVLGDLAASDRIEIDERWSGLGPPHQRRTELSRRGPVFVGEARGIKVERARGRDPEPPRALQLPAADVERALRTLAGSALTGQAYRPELVLDSSPRITMTVWSGGQPFVFESTSSGERHVPWQCTVGTRRFVAPSFHPGVAFEALKALVGGKPEPAVPDEGLVDTSDLRLAAQLGDAARVRELIAKGAATDRRTAFDGETPLTAAARWGQAATVEALLAAGAKPAATNADGETALALAAANGHASIVKRLTGSGPPAGPADASLIVAAAESGSLESVRTLVAGQHLGTDASAALVAAARWNSVEMIRLLLEAGVPVEARTIEGTTPLSAAITQGHLQAVEALIAAGASARATWPGGWSLLHAAARTGHPDVVEALLRAGADPSAVGPPWGSTPLFMIHAPDVVAALVKGGAKPDARRDDGATPLVALPTAHFGWGPYSTSAPRRDPPPVSRAGAARALLDAGADVNAVDAKGVSALQAAATFPIDEDDAAMGILLVERGSALDRRNEQGKTVLRTAADQFLSSENARGARWVEPLLRALVKAGAPDPPDANGMRAIDLARRRGSARLVALLSGGGSAGAGGAAADVALGLPAAERETLLGRARKADRIEISFESFRPDRSRQSAVLTRNGETFAGEWSDVRIVERTEEPKPLRPVRLEAKDVEPLLAMLTESTLVDRPYDPKSAPGRLFNVGIVAWAGDDRLSFFSSSVAPDFVPWQFHVGDRRFVVTSNHPARVYAALRTLVTGQPTASGSN